MGEYAKYHGQEIKIGTCESMYYLRADQAHLVTALEGNVDPLNKRERASIRFRFPFPSEDSIEPGSFDYPLPDVVVSYPAELPAEHSSVMVETGEGRRRLSASLPCPSTSPEVWHQHVQAYCKPAVRIAYQGERGERGEHGALAVIVECAYCDGMWNLPEWEQAEALVVSIRSEADALRRQGEHRIAQTHARHGEDCGDPLGESEIRKAAELHEIANRITAGYSVSVTA